MGWPALKFASFENIVEKVFLFWVKSWSFVLWCARLNHRASTSTGEGLVNDKGAFASTAHMKQISGPEWRYITILTSIRAKMAVSHTCWALYRYSLPIQICNHIVGRENSRRTNFHCRFKMWCESMLSTKKSDVFTIIYILKKHFPCPPINVAPWQSFTITLTHRNLSLQWKCHLDELGPRPKVPSHYLYKDLLAWVLEVELPRWAT